MKPFTKKHQNISAIKVTLISLIVDLFDIFLNIVVALLTNSAIIATQSLKGIVDFISSLFVLLGVKLSHKPADKIHPFGFGREVFFWTLISSLIMVGFTSGFSFYLGYQKIIKPQPVTDMWLGILTLVIGVFTNGFAFSQSWIRLKQTHTEKTLSEILFHSSLVETRNTLIKDFSGTLAPIIGLFSLFIYIFTGNQQLDGVGAMLIAILFFFLTLFLLFSVRDLLIGKSASKKVESQIIKSAKSVQGVEEVLDLRTSIIGPEKILVNIEVHIKHNLTTQQIEKTIDQIKTSCIRTTPQIGHIQVEIESLPGES